MRHFSLFSVNLRPHGGQKKVYRTNFRPLIAFFSPYSVIVTGFVSNFAISGIIPEPSFITLFYLKSIN